MEGQRMIDIKNIPEVTDVNIAFAGVDKYLPEWKEIPEEFKKHSGTMWNKLFSDWFFCGLEELKLNVKEGVDNKKSIRLIMALMRSFSSSHEHKEAGVAYLMSLFYKEDSTWVQREEREAADPKGKNE
jgi:hypothetical protein